MFIIKWCLYFVLRVLSWTYRFKVSGRGHLEAVPQHHPLGSYILVFWHEHILTPLFFFEGAPFAVIISDSRDGQLIAFQTKKFGYDVIHGSQNREGKDKGGLRALIRMINTIREGKPVAITVDGSVGPRRYVKAGVLELARKTGAGILPISCASSRYWCLNTWDQFKIPKPFSTISVQFGEPFFVAREQDAEELAQLQASIADALNVNEEKAAAIFKLKT